MKLFPVCLFVQTLPSFCKEILFSSLKEKLSAVLTVSCNNNKTRVHVPQYCHIQSILLIQDPCTRNIFADSDGGAV